MTAPVRVVAIQEVGLDGFWIHRLLEANGLRATSSILRRLLCLDATGAPRPMRSTA